MPFYLIPTGMAPPDDKPWLLSGRDDIAKDQAANKETMQVWLKECPFPGAQANSDDKLKCLKGLQEIHDQTMEDNHYLCDLPDVCDVAMEVLKDHAPDRIVVEFHVKKAQIDQVQEVDTDTAAFAKAAKQDKYGHPEYHSEAPTWEAYAKWLKVQDNGTSSTVCLGRMEGCKTAETVKHVKAWIDHMGLGLPFQSAELLNQMAHLQVCHSWGLTPTLGENLYAPSSSFASTNQNGAVIQVLVSFRKPTEVSKANHAFTKSLEKQEERSWLTSNPKTYIRVSKRRGSEEEDGDDDDEEEKEQKNTVETTDHILWLPAFFEKEVDRVARHFNGEGESSNIRSRLQKGNTDTGNITFDIFQSNLEHIKGYLDYPSKFCGILALTLVATNRPYWMHDNECYDELPKAVKQLANIWRTVLLKKTDQELGLGIDDPDARKEVGEEMSESRRALYRLLEIRAKAFDDVPTEDGSQKIKLNWKPGKPRKRKQKNSPEEPAAVLAKSRKITMSPPASR